MKKPVNIVILAAGMGKRMKSKSPKPLQMFAGDTLLNRIVKTSYKSNPEKVIVVYPPKFQDEFFNAVDDSVTWVPQHSPKGTGHAIMEALPHCSDNASVMVLCGDVPLISLDLLNGLADIDGMGIISYVTPSPDGFGRLVREEGVLQRIVEHKDASPEQRKIQEIFSGIMIAPQKFLAKCLPTLDSNNQQNEIYFTDTIERWTEWEKNPVSVIESTHWDEIAGVNTPRQLIELERSYYRSYAYNLLEEGTVVKDPSRFDCRGELKSAQGVVIDVNVIIEGNVVLEEGCYIGPHSVLKNCTIGKNTRVEAYSYIESSQIGESCSIGPYARIRPSCTVENDCKVGNFVEMKKTYMEKNSKASHLTYLGDTLIGENVNIGAGTITCNYDGLNKHRTHVEKNSFIGSNVSLIAPLIIGENSTIGAGSVITKNTEKNALTLSRNHQKTVKDWSLRKTIKNNQE